MERNLFSELKFFKWCFMALTVEILFFLYIRSLQGVHIRGPVDEKIIITCFVIFDSGAGKYWH